MNPIFSRTLKAFCSVLAAALLSACGASHTVDPFVPTRIIGLGDAYNDTTSSIYTVRGTGTVESVVAQVAVWFGTASSNVSSYAASGSNISSLTAQISAAKSAVGGSFAATDLIVVTAGTADIKAAYGPVGNPATAAAAAAAAEAAADAFTLQIEQLIADGAKHILIMQPLEFSLTPYAASLRGTYALDLTTSPTAKFNAKVAGDLQRYVSRAGYSNNPVIFGGAGLSSTFNDYVSRGVVGVFANSTAPICGSASTLTGCGPQSSDSNYLFADGVNLTPAGNRWVASYMFNATRQGWR